MKRRIYLLAVKRLMNASDAASERVVLFNSEQIALCSKPHGLDNRDTFIIRKRVGRPRALRQIDALVVIVIKQVKRHSIALNNIKHLPCLEPLWDTCHNTGDLAQLT